MMGAIAHMLQSLYEGNTQVGQIGLTAAIAIAAVIIRFICAVASSRMGYLSSKAVKKALCEMIYRKLLLLGTSCKEQANTSEVVQFTVEGVDQLETYFGAYLPQFFYKKLFPKAQKRVLVKPARTFSVNFGTNSKRKLRSRCILTSIPCTK